MNDASPSRLGRGLSSMVSEVSGIKAGAAPTGGGFLRIPLNDIHAPPHTRHADAALVESVKTYGVLQPLLVARAESGYTLLAGARRLQAAREAGLADVPALIVPPDRAGAMDVFLEENLNRADLSEPERIHLRDRWMKETGRDLEQAEQRIPELQWEPSAPTRIKRPSMWMAAAIVLAVVSVALLALLFTAKPIDKRPVVIPVEFVETPPPPPAAPAVPPVDNAWMDAFVFPGVSRSIESDRLQLVLAEPALGDTGLNPRTLLFLNQLAAVSASAGRTLDINVTAPATAAAAAAQHLVGEGVAAERITLRIGPDGSSSFQIAPAP